MARQVALELKQGDSLVTTFRLGTKTPRASNGYSGFIPTDLTGATARLMLRTTVGAASPTLTATIANSRISITPAEGLITLNIAGADTASLLGSYVWDLEVTYSNGRIQTVTEGTLVVTQGVTRDA